MKITIFCAVVAVVACLAQVALMLGWHHRANKPAVVQPDAAPNTQARLDELPSTPLLIRNDFTSVAYVDPDGRMFFADGLQYEACEPAVRSLLTSLQECWDEKNAWMDKYSTVVKGSMQ